MLHQSSSDVTQQTCTRRFSTETPLQFPLCAKRAELGNSCASFALWPYTSSASILSYSETHQSWLYVARLTSTLPHRLTGAAHAPTPLCCLWPRTWERPLRFLNKPMNYGICSQSFTASGYSKDMLLNSCSQGKKGNSRSPPPPTPAPTPPLLKTIFNICSTCMLLSTVLVNSAVLLKSLLIHIPQRVRRPNYISIKCQPIISLHGKKTLLTPLLTSDRNNALSCINSLTWGHKLKLDATHHKTGVKKEM